MRLLVISNSLWSDNNSFGNSFSNIFGGGKYEIANISCQGGAPQTTVCSRFFQITERGIIDSIRCGVPSGAEVFMDSSPLKIDSKIRQRAKANRWQIFFWGRDLIWATNRWRTKELDEFVLDFNPDIIILPIYLSTYINNIGCYVAKLTNKPVIGYISDDDYTLKQFSLSPLFWIDRLIKRRYVRKSIDMCRVLYTITEKQKTEYQQIFGVKCRVLFKGGDFTNYKAPSRSGDDTLKFVYTGNLGSGRWRALALIGDAIAKTAKRVELVVYSTTKLTKGQTHRLTSSGVVKFMGSVEFSQIKDIQRNADVLIHVESFERKERYSARLSFSTKIVDYLEAGRCILAVGWRETAAIEYLRDNDAAIVVTQEQDIEAKVSEIVDNPTIIDKYGLKGYRLGERNHQIETIRTKLYDDLKVFTDKGDIQK